MSTSDNTGPWIQAMILLIDTLLQFIKNIYWKTVFEQFLMEKIQRNTDPAKEITMTLTQGAYIKK
jgi:hypothetical protein